MRARHLPGLLVLCLATPPGPAAAATAPELPARLSQTGLWSDPARGLLAPGVRPYAPQYPLWSDGAAKRRWIRLPPGTAIDGRDPDAWRFPIGTRLWKEFSFGRRVETRYMELGAGGRWRYATYRWDDAGEDATLAPTAGVRGAAEIRRGVRHDLPSQEDCRACHEAGPVAVLGFSALQLSSDRDPLAPHAEPLPPDSIDLAGLAARGLLRGPGAALAARPPRIEADTPRARAALGWLHANCGSCHDRRGSLASLGLDLTWRIARAPGAAAPAVLSTLDVPSRYKPADLGAAPRRILPGHAEESVLVARAASRSPARQMPPLGTKLVDEVALELLRGFADHDLASPGAAAMASPATPQHHPKETP